MRFQVSLFPYDRWGGVAEMARAVRALDALGFDAVTLPEHVLVPARPGVEPTAAVWYDNLVLASHLASVTERVRFVFNVLVLPLRHPIWTAKAIATLDQVSGGRITLGVGAGWLKGEFRALGVPHGARGAITDEFLAAIRTLWLEECPTFAGQHVSFDPIVFEPRCVQRPHVPIWIGGSGARAVRRVVEHGQGWTPMQGSRRSLAETAARMREGVAAAGRDPAELSFAYLMTFGAPDPAVDRVRKHVASDAEEGVPCAGTLDEAIDVARRFEDLGFTHLTVQLAWRTPAELVDEASRFAEAVLPAFARD